MVKLQDIDPELFASLEEDGEPSVRANYAVNQVYGADKRPKVHMWLLEKEAIAKDEAVQREERLLKAAEKSALATLWATRAAFASAAIALVALVVSVIALATGSR